MTSSSDTPVERGLDAMIIVYSLLKTHPASCEQFLRTRTSWFTTGLTLLEARAVLTKVYAVDPPLASRKLSQFAAGPKIIYPLGRELDLLVRFNGDDTLFNHRGIIRRKTG